MYGQKTLTQLSGYLPLTSVTAALLLLYFVPLKRLQGGQVSRARLQQRKQNGDFSITLFADGSARLSWRCHLFVCLNDSFLLTHCIKESCSLVMKEIMAHYIGVKEGALFRLDRVTWSILDPE